MFLSTYVYGDENKDIVILVRNCNKMFKKIKKNSTRFCPYSSSRISIANIS